MRLWHGASYVTTRFGRAQAYYYGAQGDGSAWLVAEHGTVIRRYCETGEGEDELLTLGEPLRLERSPLNIGPETVSRGVGVIALTPYGVVPWLHSPVVVLARLP